MNPAVTICQEFPSSGAPHHLLTQDMGSAATPAPFPCHRHGLVSRGEPDEGTAPSFVIHNETASDAAARESLLDRAMGPGRKKKSSEKLRRGRKPSEGLAFVARDGAGSLVGTVRLWDVAAGCRPALLLGPLAVEPSLKSAGIGSALMRRAIDEARRLGHGAILLVGDAPYYSRFGFSAEKTGRLAMPGPYERERFLGLELVEGALSGACGVLKARGRRLDRPGSQAGLGGSTRAAGCKLAEASS